MFKQFNLYKILTIIILSTTIFSINTTAQSAFNQNQVLADSDLYSLPDKFSSKEKIQEYLEKEQSILAKREYQVGFIDNGGNDKYITDDIILDISNYSLPQSLQPQYQVQKQYGNKTMKASEIIWRIAREDFGNSCALNYDKNGNLIGANSLQCINNSVRPINPAFILAIIQKESSLIYGGCAKEDADNNPNCEFSKPGNINKLSFREDRSMGYWCLERERKSSCFDENPVWKYHKGFFRQVYKGVRLLRLRIETCNTTGFYQYKTGATVQIDGVNVTLQNGLTCSLYIYTPHIIPDKSNLYSIFNLLMKNTNTVIINPPSESPKPTNPLKPTKNPMSAIRKVKKF
jgi:hypothetical protein